MKQEKKEETEKSVWETFNIDQQIGQKLKADPPNKKGKQVSNRPQVETNRNGNQHVKKERELVKYYDSNAKLNK